MRSLRVFFSLVIFLTIAVYSFAFYATREVTDDGTPRQNDLASVSHMRNYEKSLGLKTDDEMLSGFASSSDTGQQFPETVQLTKQQERVNAQRKISEIEGQKKSQGSKECFHNECKRVEEKMRVVEKRRSFQGKMGRIQGILFVLSCGIIAFFMYREGAFKEFLGN